MSVEYYNKNAVEFVEGTVNADMSAACDGFLKYLQQSGKILDAGCGSGRDSLYFIKKGYDVVAFDASEKMVEASSRIIGKQTLMMRFDEVDFENEFDGVWACASLLHVPKVEIENVLQRLVKSLKVNGILFASFKYGDDEVVRDERLFNSYNEDSLRDLMASVPELQVVEMYKTKDVRLGREGEQWVSCICRK